MEKLLQNISKIFVSPTCVGVTMSSLNEAAEESKEQDPDVDEESIALKLKGHRAKIAGIIHGNSKESKTTKFRYLATDKELMY